MKTTILLTQLLLNIETLRAFSPGLQRNVLTRKSQPSTRVFSQWDEEDEDVAADRKTFDDAGVAMSDEDEQKKVSGMGDYDSNPDYNPDDISRVRDAIRQRTESLGIERSTVSVDAIQAAQERAKSAVENGQSGASQLDLSQISEQAPRGDAEDVPAMFFEPEAEMTPEEMVEADPDGQMNYLEQVMNEVKAATWPTPAAALKEVFVLIIVATSTCFGIIAWDNLLRDTYTNLGFIPRSEDIMKGSENLVLPDGWTNGMSEDDYMDFRDEAGKESPSVAQIKEGFPEL